jgi:hypothetical protein
VRAVVALKGCGRDDAVELLDLPEAAERVGGCAAFLDPCVDGDTAAERGVFDCFEQWHRDGAFLRERGSSGYSSGTRSK